MRINAIKVVIPAIVALLGSTYAQASTTVHNCSKEEIRICYYKGSDEVDLVAYKSEKVSSGHSHEQGCESGGSDYCQRIKIEYGGGDCYTKGEIHRVKSGTYYYVQRGDKLSFGEEKPASCP